MTYDIWHRFVLILDSLEKTACAALHPLVGHCCMFNKEWLNLTCQLAACICKDGYLWDYGAWHRKGRPCINSNLRAGGHSGNIRWPYIRPKSAQFVRLLQFSDTDIYCNLASSCSNAVVSSVVAESMRVELYYSENQKSVAHAVLEIKISKSTTCPIIDRFSTTLHGGVLTDIMVSHWCCSMIMLLCSLSYYGREWLCDAI